MYENAKNSEIYNATEWREIISFARGVRGNTEKEQRMKRLIMVCTLMLMAAALLGVTYIQPGSASGVWSESLSPYVVVGLTEIENGTTLTIEPGCVVQFQDAGRLWVQGRLLAQGTIQDSILFTNQIAGEKWDGIRFVNTFATNDSSFFDYCIFEHSEATGQAYDIDGGALYVRGFEKIRVSHSRFENCSATETYYSNKGHGGAVCIAMNGAAELIDCTFSNCVAQNGAVGFSASSTGKMVNCVITNNDALLNGGGVYISNADVAMTNCDIIGNTAIEGGGIYSFNSAHLLMQNCDIAYNNAVETGAGSFVSGSILELNECHIHHNVVDDPQSFAYGGGLYITSTTASVVKNSYIYNNNSDAGGGIYANGFFVLVNCVLTNNRGMIKGGGIYCGADTKIVNCSISHNLSNAGRGICSRSFSVF